AGDVALFNSDLGKRRGYFGDILYDTPAAISMSVVDYNGTRLPNLDLTFYQMVNGTFPAGAPPMTAKTDAKGSLVLFQKDTGAGKELALPIGHTLRANPFGRIDPE